MPDMPQKKSRVLVKLFLSTLYLSAFTFGGGYVIVTLLKKRDTLDRVFGLKKTKCWIW